MKMLTSYFLDWFHAADVDIAGRDHRVMLTVTILASLRATKSREALMTEPPTEPTR